MLDGLGLTEVCVDTSVAVELFRDRDFSELRLMKFLQSRSMHLSITEIAMSEVLVGTPADRFRRFCNVAALARCAGHNWFSLGAPLYWTHKYELEFHEHAGQPRVPRHAENELEKIIARADSYATFEKWQQWLDAETRSYLDPDGWERKDREMRENAVKKLGLGSPKAREEWLKNILEVLPKQLSTNPILEILVKDEALRERVASEPHRCPSLVSLALACTMSAFGAAADLGRPSEFADLSISRNSWTDARITSEAAYADIFVSKDKGQLARAKRLQAWGFFRPKLMRWDEFGGP